MRISIILLFLLTLIFSRSPVSSSHLTELYLSKRDPNLYGTCGRCTQQYVLEGHQDRWDISDYPYFLQSGYYYVNLYGPPGTTVTLFGGKNYDPDYGFIIIRKHDEFPVSIKDLEAFAADQWTKMEAEKGRNYNGAYSAYYHPKKFFKNHITSVKWKKWWNSGNFTIPQESNQ